jgi:hypothetical protein
MFCMETFKARSYTYYYQREGGRNIGHENTMIFIDRCWKTYYYFRSRQAHAVSFDSSLLPMNHHSVRKKM